MAREVKGTPNQARDSLQRISKDNSGQRIMCLPPENPEIVVGMDKPYARLKMELLKVGVSFLGLTGLPGSGKTTLASKLCCDDQVKGKFRDHILFVTFSKSPNFKVIVGALYQHCGYCVTGFDSDEDAVKGLGLLLKKMEEKSILLVLDDVWPGSESLVENFKFRQMPDYKILVISRVVFSTVDPQIHLEPLHHEDALTLFRHFALPKDNNSYVPDENLIQEVVRACRGLPLAIKVIGRSLCLRPYDVWQKMVKEWSQGYSILDSNTNLLNFLQKSLDVLEDKSIVKECFMDLGLFPEDQKIPVSALIDMWIELYKLDEEGVEAMNIINILASRNLANLLITREVGSNADRYYNNHFVMQHDLLRELAIYQSSQEPFEQRKRLIIDINENNHQWCLKEKPQGIACIWSVLLKWCVKLKQQHVIARTLSISTDETSTSDCYNMQPTQTKVMILNVRTKEYSLPVFTEKMSKLKVLLFTNYGFHTTKLKNFELLGSLPDLKRIRLEKVSVPPLGTLKNLQKLSLYMCNTSEAFEKSTMPVSDALPILVELNIDYCKDIVELPTGLCGIRPLKKLSISNCHKFSALPQEIGKLENLEVMRLNSCTGLEGIPDSIGSLSKLSILDISNCISLRNLPEDIDNIKKLEKVYMTGCSRCELPMSVVNLGHLKCVTCDEETAASWEAFKPMLPNLRIEVPHVDVNLNWLLGTSS